MLTLPMEMYRKIENDARHGRIRKSSFEVEVARAYLSMQFVAIEKA